MNDNATAELATLIGSAVTGASPDERVILLDTAKQIAGGSDYLRARLGHLAALAVIQALQAPRPKAKPGDPMMVAAEAAFAKPQDAQR